MDRSLECSGLEPGILLLEAVPDTLRVDGVLEAAGGWCCGLLLSCRGGVPECEII